MKTYVDVMQIWGCKITGESPLPIFRDIEAHKPSKGDGTLSAAEEYRLGENTGFRVLPYCMQDKYDRKKDTIFLKTAVLENDKLIAVFLPEQGGRLYSLKNKTTGKEILYKNPVFQPANLGIRNAWFSGGIEWNCAQYGHTVLSSSPVFFARIKTDDGEDFLRMYEFERMKRLYLQIDFHLPDGADQLYANITVYNCNDAPQSMYWWSNIAIQASGKLRVFSGTEDVIYLHPESISDNTNPIRVFGKTKLPLLPTLPGLDSTYPANANYANEYFFQNPENDDACWSAAAYEDGRIMFESSTLPLRFRKMFCWGNHQGGRRWCSYLATETEGDYVEIQAGLAPTQLNSIDIPANTRWCYTQAIGEVYVDTIAAAYNEDYAAARSYVENEVRKILSVDQIRQRHKDYSKKAELPVTEIISFGAGWGALEQLRASGAGEQEAPGSLLFPVSSIGEAEYPWYLLLTKGFIPEASSVPRSWIVDQKFQKLLKDSLAKPEGNHFLSKLYLGVMLYELGERDAGVRFWKESVDMKPSPIAFRNLAYNAKVNNDFGSAISYMKKAIDLEAQKIDKAFSEEYMEILLSQNQYSEVWEFYQKLPEAVKAADRISVLAGLAAVHLDEFAFVEELLGRDLACIREGDNSLTDIFFYWQRQKVLKRPDNNMDEVQADIYVRKNIKPPVHIDFRMFVKEYENVN
jgi:tetratricopeptide (TPR) repeat protein